MVDDLAGRDLGRSARLPVSGSILAGPIPGARKNVVETMISHGKTPVRESGERIDLER